MLLACKLGTSVTSPEYVILVGCVRTTVSLLHSITGSTFAFLLHAVEEKDGVKSNVN